MKLTTWAPIVFLLLWSAGFTVAKIGIVDASPITLLALRYACVVLIIVPLCIWFKPPLPKTKRAWMHVCIVSLLIQVVYFGAAYKSFEYGASAGAVAIITCLQPVFVAMIMPLLTVETVSRRAWLGLTLGLAGSVIVIISNMDIQLTTTAGLLFAVAALTGITAGTVWEKRFGVTQHPLTTNLLQYSIGFICLLPIAWATEPMQIHWTTSFVLALFYLVVCNSILAISLLIMLIREGEATRVSALFFLVPPVTALIAWLFINEPMAPAAWLGMGVAAMGVWMVTQQSSKLT